jgi:prepilin-type N-terminal cleavage/methylation domain-containing protein
MKTSARGRRRRPSRGGFTLVEVLAALGLVASAGVIASFGATALLRLSAAAHSEAAGLAAASEKLEELLATPAASRAAGNDETAMANVHLTRIWRVRADDPAPGLDRLEVTVRWDHPSLTLLTLVVAAP